MPALILNFFKRVFGILQPQPNRKQVKQVLGPQTAGLIWLPPVFFPFPTQFLLFLPFFLYVFIIFLYFYTFPFLFGFPGMTFFSSRNILFSCAGLSCVIFFPLSKPCTTWPKSHDCPMSVWFGQCTSCSSWLTTSMLFWRCGVHQPKKKWIICKPLFKDKYSAALKRLR